MNDVSLNWKKIKRILPKGRKYALDRNPTVEEIRDIIQVADLRGKPLTLLFISGGIREGAVEGLKVRDYTRTDRQGRKIDFRNRDTTTVTLGRLVVYNGEPERYVTFTTSEACDAVDKYLEFRAEHGEMITDDSPLFRDKFDPVQGQYGHGKEGSLEGIPMTPHSIRQYYNRLLFSIGIRKGPKRRHEFSVNGFRKFFKTTAELSGMKPANVEKLMGHSIGVSDSYYRATEQDLRGLKVVDKLTVLTPPSSQEVIKLSESHQVLLQQMESKEAEIQGLKERMDQMQQGLKSNAEKMQVFTDRVEKEEQRRRIVDDILDKQPPGWAARYLTPTELKGPLTPELRKKIQGLIEQLEKGALPPPPISRDI